MLNHTKRDKLAAEVTVTYSPRFSRQIRQNKPNFRQDITVSVHGPAGSSYTLLEKQTKAEAYEAAKNLRLLYIMQHNLG